MDKKPRKNDLETKLIYEGYKTANTQELDLSSLRNLSESADLMLHNESYYYLNDESSRLPSLHIEEVLYYVRDYLDKYFKLHNINIADSKSLLDNYSYITRGQFTSSAYDKINELLKEGSPYELPIQTIDGHSLTGNTRKPIIRIPGHLSDSKRKMYFENIQLGKTVNELSICALAHELARTQQESNIGFAEDYLNKEVIGFFLERLIARELDEKTRDLLRRVRASLLNLKRSKIIQCKKARQNPEIADLVYVQSLLKGLLLYDGYSNERTQKAKDGYIKDVQRIFDGKSTVEEMLAKRNIRINNDSVSKAFLGRTI